MENFEESPVENEGDDRTMERQSSNCLLFVLSGHIMLCPLPLYYKYTVNLHKDNGKARNKLLKLCTFYSVSVTSSQNLLDK